MSIGILLKTWAKRVKRDGVTLWFAGKHPRTPWHAKILGVFVVAYALSPIDLIPDFIPIIGYLDDALILPGLATLTVKLIPVAVMAECKLQAQVLWDGQGKSKWIYALPIFLIYALVSVWIVSLIVS